MNRLPYLLQPSPGDKLLKAAYGAKIEMLRYPPDEDGDEGCSISFELSGTVENGDAKALLVALLREFSTPATEGGEAHA